MNPEDVKFPNRSAYKLKERQIAHLEGLKRIDPQEPCNVGHVSEIYVQSAQCCECKRLTRAAWAKKNPEQNAKLKKESNHRHMDKHKIRVKRYKERHPERTKARARKYDKENAEKKKEYLREYRKQNRDLYRLSFNKRRAKTSEVYVDHKAIPQMIEKQKNKCASCFAKLDKYHIDHIMPLSKGGTHDISNIQILCVSCNVRKSAKLPEQWAKENRHLI